MSIAKKLYLNQILQAVSIFFIRYVEVDLKTDFVLRIFTIKYPLILNENQEFYSS